MSKNETLREKCPNTEFFLIRISLYRTEYKKIRTRKNAVFGQFSCSKNIEILVFHYIFWLQPTSKMLLKYD